MKSRSHHFLRSYWLSTISRRENHSLVRTWSPVSLQAPVGGPIPMNLRTALAVLSRASKTNKAGRKHVGVWKEMEVGGGREGVEMIRHCINV